MSAPLHRCWVGNTASSVCAVSQRTHPAEVQSKPHLYWEDLAQIYSIFTDLHFIQGLFCNFKFPIIPKLAE